MSRLLYITALSLLLTQQATTCVLAQSLDPQEVFNREALAQIQKPSRYPVPASHSPGFQLSTDFPSTVPADTNPWENIDFTQDPDGYLAAVLSYVLEGNIDIDWRVGENSVRTWYHAPWMHFGSRGREPIRGLTSERRSRPFELHELQTDWAQNWAVGFYNAAGGTTLGTVWEDPAAPDTREVIFPIGTVSAKLLFTSAQPEQVPYLADSLVWQAQINRNETPVDMRLLQIDIAVRDKRAETATGWVFGTFIYRADADGAQVWDRMVPVGLHWGNDPERTLADHNSSAPLSEGWTNPEVVNEFAALPRKWLGLWGRMNGPVDNPGSACLACHSRAMDLGERTDAQPPFAPNSTNPAEVLHYFANRAPTEPYTEGFRPLDYSLQLADGIANYREWVRSNHSDFVEYIYGPSAATPTFNTKSTLEQDLPEYLQRVAPMLVEEIYESPFSRAE